jgi:hypothetical protein
MTRWGLFICVATWASVIAIDSLTVEPHATLLVACAALVGVLLAMLEPRQKGGA